MIFDNTCRGNALGLSHSWIAGGILFSTLNRLHAYKGVSSWKEALIWLGDVHRQSDEEIDEIQFWGHGRWGAMLIDGEAFDASSLAPDHRLSADLDRVRDRLHRDTRIWIRTCETFGAKDGQGFAEKMAERFQCTIAGHTYIIGPFQSGLHIIKPGEQAYWDPWEGIREGTPEKPIQALWSKPGLPRTVSFLNINIPKRLCR